LRILSKILSYSLYTSLFLLSRFKFHTFHTMEIHILSILFISNKTNTFMMIPLLTNLTLYHIILTFIRFSTNTKCSSLLFNYCLSLFSSSTFSNYLLLLYLFFRWYNFTKINKTLYFIFKLILLFNYVMKSF